MFYFKTTLIILILNNFYDHQNFIAFSSTFPGSFSKWNWLSKSQGLKSGLVCGLHNN